MRWNKTSITRWHRETFPECDVGSQRLKLAEESEEYYYAKGRTNKLEELADVYITASSLWMRYHDYAGKFILDMIEHFKIWGELQDAIDAKMDINVMRKWQMCSGNWRHVGYV